MQFQIEDILVNGPPWNTRVALRVQSFLPDSDGGPDVYNNRAIALLETRWGRLLSWEDYEDTERVAAWDRTTALEKGTATLEKGTARSTAQGILPMGNEHPDPSRNPGFAT